MNIGYGDGVQTSVDAVKVSASKSKMNSNGTTYQNGRFVDVDEVHNNTKNMTLSGFNQEGGKVTGNIQNLTIESKQNTSITKGSTTGGSLSIAPNGLPSGSANYSQTNGERKVVDSPTTFIIGDGSNLKVGKVENTAGAIGTTGSGKLSIDEYVGYNLENVDKLKTVGGSVGVSASGITSLGVNYSDRKQEGITKNTVIGNVEIGKSSGAEINKDLGSMTEITKDRDFKTDINIESQTINYAKNPEAFKQDLKKAKNEIEDIGNVIENTVNPPGEDKRNFFKNLRAQRWNTSFYNVTGSRMEELSRQFKAGEINEKQLKEAVRELAKGYGKDIGIEYEVVYLDEETMPEDAKGSTGAAYKGENGKILIPIDVSKIEDINQLFGTLTEEISHGKDALEGRQDKKVAEDETNKEKGLESLGRPANDYVKNKLGEDNNSKIKLSTDGIDLTNADVGEKVGDGEGFAFFKASLFRGVSSYPIIYKKDNIEMDPIGMTKEYKKLENEINLTLEEENLDISSKRVHTKLSEIAEIGGTGYTSSPYEGLYVIDSEDVRNKILDKNNNLHLEKFDPPGWKKLEQGTLYKNGVENLKRKAQEKYEKNKDIINKKPDSSSTSKKNKLDKTLDEIGRVNNFMVSLTTPPSDEKDIYKVRENVKFASLNEGKIKNNLEYALGNSTLVGTIFMKDGIPYLRYNLSDTFEDITGSKRKAGIELEYGKPYDMLGPSKEIPLFDEKGMKK